jgi:putative ABC transport system permease protein
MLKNYFKTAWRNLKKQKALSFINVFGLSVGLACIGLCMLYAVNEFSFDRFHKNVADIYRVYEWTEGLKGSEPGGDGALYTPLGPAMKRDLPEVENYVRIYGSWDEKFMKAGNKTIRMPLTFADPQLFSVFSFQLLSGNPLTVLRNHRDAVITKDRALQLFGQTNVIGKTVEINVEDKFEPFIISGVAENIPANSTIQFNVLLSYEYFETTRSGKGSVNNWQYSGFQNFVQIKSKSQLPSESVKLARFREKYFPNEKSEYKQQGQWDGKGPFPVSFRLQALRDIHFNPKIKAGAERSSDKKYIWILLSIAAGLLLIACINFTTLAIGRSAGRAKEVGVRKVIGSNKKKLIFQFLTVAFLLSFLSGAIGLLLLQLLLPYFNQLSGKQLHFSVTEYPELSWLYLGTVLFAGFLAGIYPALVFSSLKPIEVLKNKLRLGGSNLFTKSLVSFQFILSIGLIISTIIILKQLNYMRSKNPGFNKENVVVIYAEGTDSRKIYPLFRQALTGYEQVSGVTGSNMGFGEGASSSGFDYNGKHEQAFNFLADHDYLKVLGMQLLAGRNFDSKIVADTVESVIVNEAMVRDLGLSNEKILGLKLGGYSSKYTPIVIGVVRDYNFLPVRQEITAILFRQPSVFAPSKYYVRIKPGNPGPALDVIRKTWSGLVTDIPIQYSFLDNDLDQLYKTEAKWSGIVGWAGSISILLACLGLFGLSALTAANRTKEIGIRKIMGASTSSIVELLSKDFLKLVIISLIVASPIVWWLMNQWLQDFAYRININWWVFVFVGIGSIIIALLTISFQAIKAAIANPAGSLRAE